MFQMVTCNLAVLAIAAVYYAYRDAAVSRTKRRAALNHRVSYLLWAAAQKAA